MLRPPSPAMLPPAWYGGAEPLHAWSQSQPPNHPQHEQCASSHFHQPQIRPLESYAQPSAQLRPSPAPRAARGWGRSIGHADGDLVIHEVEPLHASEQLVRIDPHAALLIRREVAQGGRMEWPAAQPRDRARTHALARTGA